MSDHDNVTLPAAVIFGWGVVTLMLLVGVLMATTQCAAREGYIEGKFGRSQTQEAR